MDWIEEKINILIAYIKNFNLKKSLIYIMVLWLSAALLINIVTRSVCSGWILVIKERYITLNMVDSIWKIETSENVPVIIKEIFIALNILYQYGIIGYIIIAEYIGVSHFLKSKVNSGINAAQTCIEYIKLGDLGHEQTYFSNDEIGELCNRVEDLRKQMIRLKCQEWKAQSEQREINAAFAHDLRTPLTVMKGYTEFLLKYQPTGKISEESLMEKLDICYQQQKRLLTFSKTMTEIQSIDMRELKCKSINLSDIISKMQNTINIMERQTDKEILVSFFYEKSKCMTRSIIVDDNLMMEVFENLISNAMRYAEKNIDIELSINNNSLIIFVKDDGKGFSISALKQAKNLYWSEDKSTGSHFGMGLYMCEKLCQKHGGRLSIINAVEGGSISAAEFEIG